MAKKLFVGSLPWATTSEDLQKLFEKVGKVASATVITDKFSGRSKGYGFVEMESDDDAEKAVQELNGSELEGANGPRKIVVDIARPREERDDRGGFGGSRGRRDKAPAGDDSPAEDKAA